MLSDLDSKKSNTPPNTRSTTSSSSPLSKRHVHFDSRENHTPPNNRSIAIKATPSSSIEAVTGQSHEDDKSDSEQYDTPSGSDSQSNISSSHHSEQSPRKSTKFVAPRRLSLRPRAGGKASVKSKLIRNKSSALKSDSSSVNANTDNIEAGATSTALLKTENGNETVAHTAGITNTERPARASKTVAKTSMVRQMKPYSKWPTNESIRRSSRQPSHFKNTDDTRVLRVPVSVREQDYKMDQLDDSEECSSGTDDDSTTSSPSNLNTDKEQETSTVTLNWERLSSKSSYQHYYIIDDMIMSVKKQESDSLATGSLQLVRAGESRFFAPRYSRHNKDLIQWVTCVQPNTPPLRPKYLSIYQPCDDRISYS